MFFITNTTLPCFVFLNRNKWIKLRIKTNTGREGYQKSHEPLLYDAEGDSVNHISQAPLAPGSLLGPAHGRHRWTNQWEQRREMFCETQFLCSIPPADTESSSPRITLLWPDCGCQLCPRDGPQAWLCPPTPTTTTLGSGPATWGPSKEDSGNTISSLLFPQPSRWWLAAPCNY